VRVTLAAVLIAAAVGVGANAAPLGAAVIAALLVAVAVMLRHSTALFAGSMLLLAYTPEYLGVGGPLSRPEFQKGSIYLALLVLIAARGVNARMLLPVAAYVVLAVLSILHKDLAPGLTAGQMVSSFVTLTVGWVALSVRWRETDLWLLKVVAALPVLCVLLGVVLQLAGLHELVQPATAFDPVARLRGAAIASQLALIAFVASIVATVLWRLTRWRFAPLALVLNVAILAATASRGAAVALAIALAAPILRYALASLRRSPRLGVLQLAALAAVVGVAVAVMLPRLEARNTGGRYYAGHGTITDPSSGRDVAWNEYYAIAWESPLYGHGLGAGPVIKIEQQGFLAQHNEYLRLFLEGGFVGGGLVLYAMMLAVCFAVARAPRVIRLNLVGAGLGVAFVAVTDNPLSSVGLIVPFCLLLGICASLRDRSTVMGPIPVARPAPASAVPASAT
jgi:O-antigen ligase